MKIIEAIEAPLYVDAYKAANGAISAIAKKYARNFEGYPTVADILANQADEDRYHKAYDAAWQVVQRDKESFRPAIMKETKTAIESAWRELAISYIEGMFGARQDYEPGTPYEEVKKKNLNWLNYIIIDLDATGVNHKGKPQTGGGHFSEFPVHDRYTDSYSREDPTIASGNRLGVAIKVHADPVKMYDGIVYEIMSQLSIQYFGERQEPNYVLDEFLKKTIPTYVHEVVHMEQYSRMQRKGPHSMWGMTYTPQVKQRPKLRDYKTPANRPGHNYRGGLRGRPSHLGDDYSSIDMSEWIEYFGTDHEIEAHAAGAAAGIMNDIYRNAQQRAWAGNEAMQSDINNGVDAAIQDIAQGFMSYNDVPSLKSYYEEIREKAYKLLRLRKWKDERELNKINIGARKVWTIFLRKLVKHLQAYKKQLPKAYAPDWDYAERTMGRGFRLPYPNTKPSLPG